MRLVFKKLYIHHFLSFGDAEITLNDQGYCFIQGINNNLADASKSNGSGKSAIANAVAFAILGETISGLKSNLGNLYFDDGCYVKLEFSVDGVEYSILRSREDKTYGTNLKIVVDGKDVSGKGIRESQAVLNQILPDLTRELLGGVIILGQGLPDRFTANTPSGRKEVLERLSKSDFMIQDLKSRIENRMIALNSNIRTVENNIISSSSQKAILEEQLAAKKDEYNLYIDTAVFENSIAETNTKLAEVDKRLKEKEDRFNFLDVHIAGYTRDYVNTSTLKQEAIEKVTKQHEEAVKELNNKHSEITSHILSLNSEISRLEAITDVCPTCGQKIPGAVKPDTSKQKAELEEWKIKEQSIINDKKQDQDEFNAVLKDISDKFDSDVSKYKKLYDDSREEFFELKESIDSINKNEKNKLLEDLNKYTNSLNNVLVIRERLSKEISEKEVKITELNNSLSVFDNSKEDLNKHLDVVNKMNTYVKRDFRGILLSNSINYIAKKAKEYCSKIFNTDNIEFKLDGNDIGIYFCNKEYENLSGGEKQRVDLITQFAIRDMMSKNLNFSSNILFLDEITDNLDSESCDKVIDFITKELNDIESVFIISHHSDISIPIDNQIKVVKNSNGVSEVLNG